MSYIVDPSQVCGEIYEIRESKKSNSVADQDLPRGGMLTLEGGAPMYYLAKILPKTA